MDAKSLVRLVEGHGNVRVRFAPNGEIPFPGFIVRTVLYSWLFARRFNGAFILRFDDTDLDRQVQGALQSYPDGMRWLGLQWDEGPEAGGAYGPYSQSQRLHLYREALDQLLASGAAYRCYCSPERLAELAAAARRPGAPARAYDGRCRRPIRADIEESARKGRAPAIRLRVPDDGMITSTDLLRGPISVPAGDLSDIVICRPDGWPTYHLTVVVDDSLMRISHVIRGIEGLPNMAPQAIVHRALGLEAPLYLHHPLVRTAGFSIGERFLPHGHLLYLEELRNAGFPPEAVVNYYALLGYGHNGKEIRTLDQLIESYDFTRISRKEFVVQSLEKLAWMNRTYLRSEASTVFVEEFICDRLRAAGANQSHARALAARAVPVLCQRLGGTIEIAELLGFALERPGSVSVTPEVGRWAQAACAALAVGDDLGDSLKRLAGGDRQTHGRIVRTLLTLLGAEGTPLALADVVRVLGLGESRERWLPYAR
ncbi:glutamate--tRNA ligase [Nonomuraea sp. NPDC050643]|uniref:glutamate--tRNA ligase n=1 Tax=Nonomuraea sp. NPDC050643 TaxID=3155660 RepID=UPI00340FF146